jgi:hypothetical protein
MVNLPISPKCCLVASKGVLLLLESIVCLGHRSLLMIPSLVGGIIGF